MLLITVFYVVTLESSALVILLNRLFPALNERVRLGLSDLTKTLDENVRLKKCLRRRLYPVFFCVTGVRAGEMKGERVPRSEGNIWRTVMG